MAVRVDYTEVQTVIDTDLTSGQITQFIADASAWVDDQLAGTGASATILALIEKYLACHLITLRDPRLKQTAVGDVQETYQRNLYVTEYLKAAMALDATGKVADAFGPKRMNQTAARFRVGAGFNDDQAAVAS